MAQARSDAEELVQEFKALSVTESESGDEKHSVAKKYRIWYKIGNAMPPKNFEGKEKTVQQLCKETEGVKVTHVKIWGDVPEPSALKLVAPNLRRLDLRDIPHTKLKLPEQLEVIDISENRLEELPAFLADFQHLHSLYAKECCLSKISGLKALKALEILDLSFNQKLDVEELSQSLPVTLKRLYLNQCSLDLNKLRLGGVDNLTSLSVSGNVVEETFLKHVSECSKGLKRLNIANCGLTQLPDCVSNLEDLEVLDVRDSPWNRDSPWPPWFPPPQLKLLKLDPRISPMHHEYRRPLVLINALINVADLHESCQQKNVTAVVIPHELPLVLFIQGHPVSKSDPLDVSYLGNDSLYDWIGSDYKESFPKVFMQKEKLSESIPPFALCHMIPTDKGTVQPRSLTLRMANITGEGFCLYEDTNGVEIKVNLSTHVWTLIKHSLPIYDAKLEVWTLTNPSPLFNRYVKLELEVNLDLDEVSNYGEYCIWYSDGSDDKVEPPDDFEGKLRTASQFQKETADITVTHMRIWGEVPPNLRDLVPDLEILDLRNVRQSALNNQLGGMFTTRLKENSFPVGIKSLTLRGFNLSRKDFYWLHLPEHLKEIDISENQVERLPEVLADLQSLERLYARGCGLTNISALETLKKLKILDLSRNTGLAVQEMPHVLPGSLTTLIIDECKLDLKELQLDNLRILEHLSVSGNMADETFFNHLSKKVTQLKELNISNCELTYLPDCLNKLRSLERLDIRGNKMLRNIPASIVRLPEMKHLLRDSSVNLDLSPDMDEFRDYGEYCIWYSDGSGDKVEPPDDFEGKPQTTSQFEEDTANITVTHMRIWGEVPHNLRDLVPDLEILDLRDAPQSALREFPLLHLPKHLKEIDISENQLESLPKFLADLQSLERLYARGCGLTNISALETLKKLKILDLSRNLGLDVQEMSHVLPGSLTTLIIDECKLDLKELQLDNLRLLEHLSVSGNMSDETFFNRLSKKVTQLKGLNIRNCRLTYLPDWLYLPEHLKKIDISENQLGSLPKFLAVLQSLERLYARGCNLTNISALETLKKLKILDLSRNMGLDVLEMPHALPGSLTTLFIDECKLELKELQLDNLRILGHLSVSGNMADETFFNHLSKKVTQLKELNISNCGLTYLPDCLNKLRSLERLDISDNEKLTNVPESIVRLPEMKDLLRDLWVRPQCGLFINKDVHNKIKKLDVLRNFDEEVTIVWMYSKASKQSLFFLSAGSLDKGVARIEGTNVILTYHIINDRLHKFIKDNSTDHLSQLSQEKKEKLQTEGPRYLISTSLPNLKSRPAQKLNSDEDSDSDESNDKEWFYECEGILEPAIGVENGGEMYTYRSNSLTVRLYEPKSPVIVEFLEIFIRHLAHPKNRNSANSMAMRKELKTVTNTVRDCHQSPPDPSSANGTNGTYTAMVLVTSMKQDVGSKLTAGVFLLKGLHQLQDHRTHARNKSQSGCPWMALLCPLHMQQLDQLQDFPGFHDLTNGTQNDYRISSHLTVNFSTAQANGTFLVHCDATVDDITLDDVSHKLKSEDFKSLKEKSTSAGLDHQLEASHYIDQVGSSANVDDKCIIFRFGVFSRWQITEEGDDFELTLRADSERIGQTTKAILALGPDDCIVLPKSFEYMDPFTTVSCEQKIVCSSGLAKRLKSGRKRKPGVAKYELHRLGKTKSDGSHKCPDDGKCSKTPTSDMISFKAHKINPHSLISCSLEHHEEIVKFCQLRRRLGWPSICGSVKTQCLNWLRRRKILPQSYQFATMKLDIRVLGPPEFIGVGSSSPQNQSGLFAYFENEAHMLFHTKDSVPNTDISDALFEKAFGSIEPETRPKYQIPLGDLVLFAGIAVIAPVAIFLYHAIM